MLNTIATFSKPTEDGINALLDLWNAHYEEIKTIITDVSNSIKNDTISAANDDAMVLYAYHLHALEGLKPLLSLFGHADAVEQDLHYLETLALRGMAIMSHSISSKRLEKMEEECSKLPASSFTTRNTPELDSSDGGSS